MAGRLQGRWLQLVLGVGRHGSSAGSFSRQVRRALIVKIPRRLFAYLRSVELGPALPVSSAASQPHGEPVLAVDLYCPEQQSSVARYPREGHHPTFNLMD